MVYSLIRGKTAAGEEVDLRFSKPAEEQFLFGPDVWLKKFCENFEFACTTFSNSPLPPTFFALKPRKDDERLI